MKTTYPLFFFFLLFAFTTRAFDLYDSDGDILENGGRYYFSPPESAGGGVIVAAAIRWGTTQYCNLGVVQFWDFSPWSITVSAKHRARFLRSSDRIFIKFSYLAPNVCTNSSNWVVTESQPLGQSVMLAASPNFPQPDPIVGRWFHIRHYGTRYYKLVVCGDSSQDCRDIGIHTDNEGYSRLVVSDNNPLIFKFDKVKKGFHSDISMVV